jgi:hypothetical protein
LCSIILVKTIHHKDQKKEFLFLFTIDSSSLHLIDNFFNFALSLSNSEDNSRFFLDNSTTLVAIASPPTALGPKKVE